MNALRESDAVLLRAAIGQARLTLALGNRPYRAVIADSRGQIIASAGNTANGPRDCTAHAEVNAIRAAFGELGREGLAEATIYASGEPCLMCSGAIYWSGLRRVVYGLGLSALAARQPPERGAMPMLGCREVLARVNPDVEVVGPALEDEILALFDPVAAPTGA